MRVQYITGIQQRGNIDLPLHYVPLYFLLCQKWDLLQQAPLVYGHFPISNPPPVPELINVRKMKRAKSDPEKG